MTVMKPAIANTYTSPAPTRFLVEFKGQKMVATTGLFFPLNTECAKRYC
jgi:hypothetical protein